MTDAAETPSCAGEAAAEYRKARDANDKLIARADELDSSGRPAQADRIRAETAARSLEIAEGLTRLAAIEEGLPPCYHPLRPAREETP